MEAREKMLRDTQGRSEFSSSMQHEYYLYIVILFSSRNNKVKLQGCSTAAKKVGNENKEKVIIILVIYKQYISLMRSFFKIKANKKLELKKMSRDSNEEGC